MNDAQELDSTEWWILYRTAGGALVLSALCGLAALYSLEIILSDEEREMYEREGRDALSHLAQQIYRNPSAFAERRVMEW